MVCLFSEAAQKGAHFVELCSQRKIPLVFLQNITGFMVGRKYENEGIARHGAKMVTAVATTSVPKITHCCRGFVWCGELRHVRTGLFAAFYVELAKFTYWCDGRAQAAGVLATVKRDGIERKGGEWSAEDEARSNSRRLICSRNNHILCTRRRVCGMTG